jgi:pimeloyl-ACP methyl ester carboxylesterase
VSALVLISAPAPELVPSDELEAAWAAENEALERGDLDAAAAAVADAWTLPDAPAQQRERVRRMQRRSFELQKGVDEIDEADDPAETLASLASIDVPTLVAVGARDTSDFTDGALKLAEALPNTRHAVIDDAGHLAPLETPDAFRELVLDYLGA